MSRLLHQVERRAESKQIPTDIRAVDVKADDKGLNVVCMEICLSLSKRKDKDLSDANTAIFQGPVTITRVTTPGISYVSTKPMTTDHPNPSSMSRMIMTMCLIT